MIKNISIATKIIFLNITSIIILSMVVLSTIYMILFSFLSDQARERQDSNMAVALDVLSGFGQIHLEDGILMAGKTSLNNNNGIVDHIVHLVGGTATIFQNDVRIASNVKKPDGSRATGTFLAAGPVYDSVLKEGKRYLGEANILGVPFFTSYEPLKDSNGKVLGILYVGIPKSDFLAVLTQLFTTIGLVILGVISIVVVIVSMVIRRTVITPLREIIATMDDLSQGNIDIDIPDDGRSDEIGDMAKAIIVFKEQAISNRALEDKQKKEHEMDIQRAEKIGVLIRDFDVVVSETLNSMSDSGDSLNQSVQQGTELSSNTLERCAKVATDTEQASASVESVATASEELSASIREIYSQVNQSNDVSVTTATEAKRTNEIIMELANFSNEIGDVLNLITDIASQTNLLALNATIEAARAGESGKGFAVVANEVKNLANQTAKATEQISNQISSIQQASQTAVSAIGNIVVRINEIGEISSTISNAVEGQSSATDKIFSSVKEASQGTRQVSKEISDVLDATHKTADSFSHVQEAMKQMIIAQTTIREEVQQFLKNVQHV